MASLRQEVEQLLQGGQDATLLQERLLDAEAEDVRQLLQELLAEPTTLRAELAAAERRRQALEEALQQERVKVGALAAEREEALQQRDAAHELLKRSCRNEAALEQRGGHLQAAITTFLSGLIDKLMGALARELLLGVCPLPALRLHLTVQPEADLRLLSPAAQHAIRTAAEVSEAVHRRRPIVVIAEGDHEVLGYMLGALDLGAFPVGGVDLARAWSGLPPSAEDLPPAARAVYQRGWAILQERLRQGQWRPGLVAIISPSVGRRYLRTGFYEPDAVRRFLHQVGSNVAVNVPAEPDQALLLLFAPDGRAYSFTLARAPEQEVQDG